MEAGYEDVTLQKIADKCGITRTTLYLYFRNKREIFNFSIKQFLQILESSIVEIGKEKNLSHTERLIRVMTVIIEGLEENRRILSVLLDYLLFVSKGDYNPDYRVRRRTVRLRHILANMLIEGIKSGEFKQSMNVKDANELLSSIIEAAIYRLVVLGRSSAGELIGAMKLAIRNFGNL